MKSGSVRRAAAAIALSALFITLSSGFLRMPQAGVVPHPSYRDAAVNYISGSIKETNSPNVVNAIVTDYRAFDTLGEAIVLFVSISAVGTVLVSARARRGK